VGRRNSDVPSQAIRFAFTYVKTHLLPLLLRIWPMPDDLPHAAGNGDLARVRRWFDAEGKPALGKALGLGATARVRNMLFHRLRPIR
jgi:hypothetical protein